MKKSLLFLVFILTFLSFTKADDQLVMEKPYTSGEYFKFKVSYSKFLSAGYATLELTETIYNNKSVYFAKGFGTNTGLSKLFFKVEDHYQSYFDKETGKPYMATRNISEGSYKRNQRAYFNQNTNKVIFKDFTKNKEKTIDVSSSVHDVISTFYHLRNHEKIDQLKVGETIDLDMFFDDEIFGFKLKLVGTETLKTKFGKIETMIFKPIVQSGRVFKKEESLTIWISADKNKMPLRIKADLAVGNLSVDLHQYKGLKYPFNTK